MCLGREGPGDFGQFYKVPVAILSCLLPELEFSCKMECFGSAQIILLFHLSVKILPYIIQLFYLSFNTHCFKEPSPKVEGFKPEETAI